jgi:hypothetical protein
MHTIGNVRNVVNIERAVTSSVAVSAGKQAVMHAEQKAVELDAPVRPLLLLASSLHDSVLAAESAQLTGGLPAVQSGVDPSLELGLSVPASPAGNRKLLELGLKSELEPALESGLESGVKPGQAPMEDLLDLFADEDAIRYINNEDAIDGLGRLAPPASTSTSKPTSSTLTFAGTEKEVAPLPVSLIDDDL